MSNFLFYLTAFALVLGTLIIVHELGHYLIARWAGVKVLRFSVGFGRALYTKRFGRDHTEWSIGAFPLGGYVKMLDEREAEVAPEELHRSFNRQSVWKRMAIVAAGPLANLLLAVVVYWGLFSYGVEELRPILGTPSASSAAALAGFENGERVVKLGGEEIQTWQDMRWLVLRRAADQDSIDFEVINQRHEVAIRRLSLASVRESGWEGEALEKLGLTFYRPLIPPVLDKINTDSPADLAGLKPGDLVISIDSKPIQSWHEVVQTVRASPGKPLHFVVSQNGISNLVTVTPAALEDSGSSIGRIGASVKSTGNLRNELMVRVSYDIFTAFGKALDETWDKSIFSVQMIGKMIVGEVSWRNISGPVTIADYAGQSAKLGLDYYLKFLALVSISLAVLNLLPIPILDGGHLLYYVVEIIKGGPLSERSMEIGQQIGLALMLMLMAFAFYNDINRLISG